MGLTECCSDFRLQLVDGLHKICSKIRREVTMSSNGWSTHSEYTDLRRTKENLKEITKLLQTVFDWVKQMSRRWRTFRNQVFIYNLIRKDEGFYYGYAQEKFFLKLKCTLWHIDAMSQNPVRPEQKLLISTVRINEAQWGICHKTAKRKPLGKLHDMYCFM